MPYSVLQAELNPPAFDKLRRAFRSVPGLTELDAHTLGQDAFGILVKNFPIENAMALQGALRREGVETVVVDQAQLPALPTTKFVHRLTCTEAGLEIFDPLGRSFIVAWGHVMLVAAGPVRLVDFVNHKVSRPTVRFNAEGSRDLAYEDQLETREERNFHLLLEIVLTRAVMRYSITADRFDFSCLGDRMTRDIPRNFALLVQDVLSFAPGANVNRGAQAVRDGASEWISYPSKNAFFEEITWLLWQMQRGPNPPSAASS